jgi:prophage regulatory protein
MVTQAATTLETSTIRIIRHARVVAKLDVSDAKLFDMISKGLFPRPFPIVPGGRAVGWIEADVDAWILEQKRSADGGGK